MQWSVNELLKMDNSSLYVSPAELKGEEAVLHRVITTGGQEVVSLTKPNNHVPPARNRGNIWATYSIT